MNLLMTVKEIFSYNTRTKVEVSIFDLFGTNMSPLLYIQNVLNIFTILHTFRCQFSNKIATLSYWSLMLSNRTSCRVFAIWYKQVIVYLWSTSYKKFIKIYLQCPTIPQNILNIYFLLHDVVFGKAARHLNFPRNEL